MKPGPRLLADVADSEKILMAIDPNGHARIVTAPVELELTDQLITGEVFTNSDDGHIRITLHTAPAGRRVAFNYRGNPPVFVLGDHHQICAACGEIWPCRDLRTDQATRAFDAEIATLPEVTP